MFKTDFLFRKKKFDTESLTNTNLHRILGIFDVTAIGISSTLGSGIYVLAGTVITKFTGPSIILSFIIAGIATFFSGICYAELGARVPRSGSAYVYIYVTIGEVVAFVMGWDLILEYVLGTASVANALSQYIDSFTGRKIRAFMTLNLPMTIPHLGPYPDFLAFGLVVVVTTLMIVGVKESTKINKLFTVINISVLSFIIIGGSTRINSNNWHIKTTNNLTWIDVNNVNQSCSTSHRCGTGGFTPFGVQGIFNGAAKCFYAYIGFDAIASTGEEVINPKKVIPLSILITLLVASVLYCSLSSVLTLMIPYYVLDPDTPIPHAFEYVHLHWLKYIVSAGAVLSLCTCLYAGMFPMPRVLYSMASDGLIFKFLSKIQPKLKTPFLASITGGLFAGILAAIFNLDELVDMMSIGTLMAYSLVSICVLILRYRPAQKEADDKAVMESVFGTEGLQNFEEEKPVKRKMLGESNDTILKRLFSPSVKEAHDSSYRLVNTLAIFSVINIVVTCFILAKCDLSNKWILAVVGVNCSILVFKAFIIWCQPQDSTITTFKTPFIPILPLVSCFINTYMMTTLTGMTWVRFLVWFGIGLIVYYTYGLRNSKENKYRKGQSCLIPCFFRKDYTVEAKESDVKLEDMKE